MAKTLPAPKVGDKCPIDGGEFKRRAQPTDAQRAAAKDRDNPVPLPPLVDSADPVQIGELGELYVCATCGYTTRMKPEAKRAPDAGTAAGRPAEGARPEGQGDTGDRAAAE